MSEKMTDAENMAKMSGVCCMNESLEAQAGAGQPLSFWQRQYLEDTTFLLEQLTKSNQAMILLYDQQKATK